MLIDEIKVSPVNQINILNQVIHSYVSFEINKNNDFHLLAKKEKNTKNPFSKEKTMNIQMNDKDIAIMLDTALLKKEIDFIEDICHLLNLSQMRRIRNIFINDFPNNLNELDEINALNKQTYGLNL